MVAQAAAVSEPAPAGAADVAANLARVGGRVAEACREAGRSPAEVTLVAISKLQPAAAIERAIRAGHLVFGENRVQEAETKWPALKAAHAGVRLHLVGPLQRNKVRRAVKLFDAVETVDRPKIAEAIAEEIRESGRRPDLFVQVNTGEEPQKAGVAPAAADAFIAACQDQWGLPIVGLMCIPPADEEPALHFALLREIARRNGLDRLSMGMSADFEIAVRFGATHVRVGTAIFGPRPAA